MQGRVSEAIPGSMARKRNAAARQKTKGAFQTIALLKSCVSRIIGARRACLASNPAASPSSDVKEGAYEGKIFTGSAENCFFCMNPTGTEQLV